MNLRIVGGKLCGKNITVCPSVFKTVERPQRGREGGREGGRRASAGGGDLAFR